MWVNQKFQFASMAHVQYTVHPVNVPVHYSFPKTNGVTKKVSHREGPPSFSFHAKTNRFSVRLRSIWFFSRPILLYRAIVGRHSYELKPKRNLILAECDAEGIRYMFRKTWTIQKTKFCRHEEQEHNVFWVAKGLVLFWVGANGAGGIEEF